MTLVQKFLRGGGALDQLKELYAVGARRHGKYPNLVQLKYDQIESPMGEPLVQECRGIILDEANNWEVVARPFSKFFNHGEQHAAEIDWSTARFQEKVDGSLIICYPYKGTWEIATSGMPDAAGECNGMGFSFRELFERTMEQHAYELPQLIAVDAEHEHPSYPFTLMFELTSPWNRIVVRHQDADVRLIGVRHTWLGHEEPISAFAAKRHALPPAAREFPLRRIEDALKTFEEMKPLEQEGYVVVDDEFRRVKVKHPGYVAIHHMRDNLSPKRMLQVIMRGESAELMAHFPEWRPLHDEIVGKLAHVVGKLQTAHDYAQDVAKNQKEYALIVKDLPLSGAVFLLRAGKVESLRSWVAGQHLKKPEDWPRHVNQVADALGLRADAGIGSLDG